MATAIEELAPQETAPAVRPAPVPVAITPRPIGDDEVRIITGIGVFAESAECSCTAGDDQPY